MQRTCQTNSDITLSSGDDLIGTQGNPKGFLITAKRPLSPLAGEDEINATKEYELPSFYPVSPTIDLTETNIYRGESSTGMYAMNACFCDLAGLVGSLQY